MREIKFRALRIFDGRIGGDKEWIHSSLLMLKPVDWEANNVRLKLGGVTCQEDTLGQYTGLKDRNGVEIYEGDVIKVDWNDYNMNCVGVVRYKAPKFVSFLKLKGGATGVWELDFDCEVVGNIHQNPELLNPDQ